MASTAVRCVSWLMAVIAVGCISLRVRAQPRVQLPAAHQLYRYGLGDAFPLTFDHPNAMVEVAGRIYVAERGGKVYAFRRDDPLASKQLVLDLGERVIAAADSGLLALAVRERELYVFYATWVGQPVALTYEQADSDFSHELRLSRFRLDAQARADASSEQILIALRDRQLFHQGGALLFHPRDGFLYLGLGDEGRIRCAFDTCQRMDRSFFGGLLRIDVDQRGGEISHPIVRQPRSGQTAHYFIPNDNPFVGRAGVLEEFYAFGLRNPYRIAYDAIDDVTFIADVGESKQEEIDVLAPGANYQWDIRDGAEPQNARRRRASLGAWTDPAWTYPHSELQAIIGGHVYRGSALPELSGRYVHADYRTGAIWAARYTVEAGKVRVLGSERVAETAATAPDNAIVSLAQGDDGEIYILQVGLQTKIQRLVASPPPTHLPPPLLSQTGLFSDVARLEPSPGLIEYSVVAPLWSDGADKRRFIALPSRDPVALSSDGPPELPTGTVFVKHFSILLDRRDPGSRRRLETRLTVVQDAGVHAVTYRWREDQRDAELVLAHAAIDIEVLSEKGQRETFGYIFPSPSECVRCHTSAAGDALGFRVAQLNMTGTGTDNQLHALARAGVIDLGGADVAALPRLAALHDRSASLETRVRSYLDSNCSFCHGSQQLYGASWDARYTTPTADTGMLGGIPHRADAARRLLKPGDPTSSFLLKRVATEELELRMPPIGSNRVDADFVKLLRSWIESLASQDTAGATATSRARVRKPTNHRAALTVGQIQQPAPLEP